MIEPSPADGIRSWRREAIYPGRLCGLPLLLDVLHAESGAGAIEGEHASGEP